MKLYHGTSAKNLDSILSQGFLPRGEAKGNWGHTIESRSDCVYLTSLYAPYFAVNSSKEDEKFALIEIETDRLDQDLFLPDEDFMEQATRHEDPNGNIHERTKYYRDNLELFSGHWDKSINHLGNCCYQGFIPVSVITRAVLVEYSKCFDLVVMAMDPLISIPNYRFCSSKYKALTEWFMGGKVSPSRIFAFSEDHWNMHPEKHKEVMTGILEDQSMIFSVDITKYL